MTTTDIATRGGSGLDIRRDQEYWTDRQLAALRQLGVEDAGPGDLTVFFHQCQRTGLDPFVRQIYMIGRRTKNQRTQQWETKQTIQTGIDGFRLVARRAADAAGETIAFQDTLWAGSDGVWTEVWVADGPPAAAKVVVVRDGRPVPGIALYREYVQTTKDGTPNSQWSMRPAHMLAKCAEALALRRAFPQDLAGVYVPEEMKEEQPAREPSRRVTAHQIIEGEADPAPNADPVTGEVPYDPAAEPEGWGPVDGEAQS